MGDDSAGSGLELGWKRLADARASVCSDRPGVTGLSVQGCPAGLSLLAACLASAAKQSLLGRGRPHCSSAWMASNRLGTGPWSREAREPRPTLPVGEALVRPEASRLAGLLTRYVARRGYAPKSVQLWLCAGYAGRCGHNCYASRRFTM